MNRRPLYFLAGAAAMLTVLYGFFFASVPAERALGSTDIQDSHFVFDVIPSSRLFHSWRCWYGQAR